MALRLHLVSKQAADLGEVATAVFGVHGGRLGRAPDNDWCLPDSQRFLSAHHAHILHRAGEWTVLDTSSNGVWYNREQEPIGRGNERRLNHGDRLRFGDYVAMVSIVQDNDFPLEADLVAHGAARLDAQLSHATENHLGVNFDIHSLLDGSGSFPAPGARRRGPPHVLVPPPSRPVAPSPLLDDAAMPLPPANSAPPPTSEQVALESRYAGPGTPLPRATVSAIPTTGALGALARGLGIDTGNLSSAEQLRLFSLAGQLLREYTLGVMAQLRQKRERAAGLGASLELTARNPNPLEALEGTDEVLRRLLIEPSQRFMGPVDAVRDAFTDLESSQQRHDHAVVGGLDHLLQALEPEQLAARFNRVLGPQGKAGDTGRYWSLYPDLHRAITQRRADGLPYAFTEGYALARDEAVREAERATGAATDVNETINRGSELAGNRRKDLPG